MSEMYEPNGGEAVRTAPLTCGRTGVGHAPNRVHILLSQTAPAEDWLPVVVMDAADEAVTLAVFGELERFAHHDADAVAAAVRDAGAHGFYNLRFNLLFLSTWPRDAEAVFSLQPAHRPYAGCRS
ncbi:hypothetical protein [Blastococcus sp. SYSU D00820]